MNAPALKISLLSLFIGLATCLSSVSSAQIIVTVAGNGAGTGTSAGSYSGDGGPATAAGMGSPSGVFIDSSGNMFVSEMDNSIIRMITPAGIISTFAGTGVAGFSGDGGPATAAKFFECYSVIKDSAGDLIICDTRNKRVRKVDASGVVTTIFGTGTAGYSGDGGPASSAQLRDTYGIFLDRHGNIYLADQGNSCIRKVDPAGTITTVAGNGSPGFSGDGGPATNATMYLPTSVCLDTAGNMYIADQLNHRIRKVSPSGIISTIAGTGVAGYSGDSGPATAAQLWSPTNLVFDTAGNLFIADAANCRIRKITPSGIISTYAGNGAVAYGGDGGPATAASLYYPTGITIDTAGNLYIADRYSHRVRKVIPSPALAVHSPGTLQLVTYPVPMSDRLAIDGIPENSQIELSDVSGRKVYSATSCAGTNYISTAHLTAGAYLLRVTTPQGETITKTIEHK